MHVLFCMDKVLHRMGEPVAFTPVNSGLIACYPYIILFSRLFAVLGKRLYTVYQLS